MAKKIDQQGVYRGELIETAFQNSKSGLPMFVATFRADEKYIETAEDLKFFLDAGLIAVEVPQWVDWSGYGETIRNYMLLFSPKEGETDFTLDNATTNYKQIQTAFGWDGTTFQELENGHFTGSKALFRCKDSDDPKFPIDVCWVDAFDAPPERELKGMDKTTFAEVSKRLKIGKKSAPKAAAAPKTKAAKPKAAAKPVATPPVATPAPAAVAAPAPAAVAAPPAPAPTAEDGPVVFTKDQAWNDVYTRGAENGPDVVSDTWIAAVAEVQDGVGLDESQFTDANWTQVRGIALKDLGVSTAA